MNFLDDYAIVTSGNECPQIFHQWAGLSVLASILGRKVWIEQGDLFNIYPNLYVMLVGDAGIKKGTAKDIAFGMLEEFREHVPMSADSFTKQELAAFMGAEDSPCKRHFTLADKPHVYTQLSLFCDEFINFLTAANEIQMINFLTESYRADNVGVRTKGSGEDFIVHPFINILACVTTDTTQELTKAKIVSSGFSRRCIYAYAAEPGNPVPKVVVTQEQKDAWTRCLQRLDQVRAVKGEVQWAEAEPAYNEWYYANHDATGRHELSVVKNWLRSKPEYVLKVAMLLSLSHQDELVVTEQNFLDALEIVNHIDRAVELLFSTTGNNPLAEITAEIEQWIKATGKVSKKRIMGRFYKDCPGGDPTKEIQTCLEFLLGQGKIREVSETIGVGSQQTLISSYAPVAT